MTNYLTRTLVALLRARTGAGAAQHSSRRASRRVPGGVVTFRLPARPIEQPVGRSSRPAGDGA